MTDTTCNSRVYDVLIVDDHPIVRHGLRDLVASTAGMNVAGETSDSGEALRLLREATPDAAVVDISLNGANGLELIKQAKAEGLNTRILVSSMHDESLYAERALRAGAMGYVNKSEGTEKILDALHQVLVGRVYLSNNMTERMLQRMMNGKSSTASPLQMLSDRELEVFEMVGHGLTTKEIASKLHLSPKTIETHREHIKSKLNLMNNTALIRHAVQWMMDSSS